MILSASKPEREREMERECDPLLRGGRRETKYSHGYSASELQTLTSICEVLIPPIPDHDQHNQQNNDESIQAFYRASASQYPVPDEVIKQTNIYIYIVYKLINFLDNCFCFVIGI